MPYPTYYIGCGTKFFYAGMMLDDVNVRVKLIDFGCATWEGGPAGSLVQTIQYRAPEVCLGLAWTYPCDMWSIGCIILELLEGQRVFDISGLTGSIPQHLAMMQRLSNMALPSHMVQRASHSLLYCMDRRSGRLLWPEVSGGGLMRDRCMDRELQVFRVMPLLQRIKHPTLYHMHDFLAAVLQLDPDCRITPSACLNCEWSVAAAIFDFLIIFDFLALWQCLNSIKTPLF